MTNVLTISGHGSGTGRSVIALNLATSLAVYEKRTLLIDCDPHGVISAWAGMDDSHPAQDLSSVMSGRTRLGDAAAKTEFNFLDVVPAGPKLAKQSQRLSRQWANEKLLRLLIEESQEIGYEYIIIDAPLSDRFLTLSAMTAADWLICPVHPRSSTRGDLLKLFSDIRYVRGTHQVSLGIAGFLFNQCEGPEDIDTFVREKGVGDIESLICRTHIPTDPLVDDALEQNIPLVLSDIKSPSASAFLHVAQEIDLKF